MAAPLTEEELNQLFSVPPPQETAPLVNERTNTAGAPLEEPIEPEKIETVTPENVNSIFAGMESGPKPNKPSYVGDVLRGIDNLQGTGGGLVELLGNVAGNETIEEWGHSVRAANDAEAQMNPAAVGSYKNIHGAGDAARYAVEAVLENAPMFLPSMITGGVGGLVARKSAETFVKNLVVKMGEEQAAKLVAKRILIGSTVGGYVSSAAMETGDIYGSVVDETGVHDPVFAMGAGAVAGLFDALPEGKMMQNLLAPRIAKQLESHLITRMGVEGAKQFLREAPTEAIQTIIEQSAITHADPSQDLFSDGRIDQYIDAGLKGGLAGSIMGAGGEALAPHPNAEVRQKEEDLLNRTQEQAPSEALSNAQPVEIVTPEDKRIGEIHAEVDAFAKEYALPETTEERKNEIDVKLQALQTEENLLLNPEPLVNEKPADVVPTEADPKKTYLEEAAKDSGAVYQGESLGLHAFKEESTGGNFSVKDSELSKATVKIKAEGVRKSFATPPEGAPAVEEVAPEAPLREGVTQVQPVDNLDDTRQAVHSQVDALVNENDDKAEGETYRKAVKDALEPHMGFIAGEKVKVKKAPRGESYGVNATKDGGIELWVPSMREWNARNARQTKSGGLLDSLPLKGKLADHEIIHAAHYSYLRSKWEKGGKKGAFDAYVAKEIKKIGRNLSMSSASIPEELASIYQPSAGPADEFTTGTEFMRMMVERARTGNLSEDVQTALNSKHRGATGFIQQLLGAAKRMKEVIDTYLNPSSSPKSIREAYAGINDVLDRYGNLQENRIKPTQRVEPQMSVAQARQLGQPLVNENPEDGENFIPTVSPEEAAARTQASSSKAAESADARRGVTPELRQTYQRQLQAARSDKTKVADAAKTHAQMQIARGNLLGTKESRRAAKAAFQTNLQKGTSQEAYDAAVKEARQNPLVPPPSRRNPEANETAEVDSNDDTGITSLDARSNGLDEAGAVDDSSRQDRHVPDAARRIEAAIKQGDFPAISEVISESGSNELHQQFFDEVLDQVEKQLETGGPVEMMPAFPIRGEDVAEKLRTQSHQFAPGKRDVSFRPEDDWFADNIWGMPYLTPSRWKYAPTDVPIVDWGGDFADSPDFAESTNEGASMKSPRTIMDKLKEAKAATGSAKSLDLVNEMGISRLTPESIDALDKEFGKGQWIVKPKAGSHSRSVFFPEGLAEVLALDPETIGNLTPELMAQQKWTPMDPIPEATSIAEAVANMARVHIVTSEDGSVHVVPYATIDYDTDQQFDNQKSEYEHVVYETPVLFPNARIRNFEQAAKVAIESLPLEDRSGSMFSVEVISSKQGYRIIELNPNFSIHAEGGRGGGGHLQNNYAVQDAVISAMKGELPLHARIAQAAIEGGAAVSRRSPEMQELEGAAHSALDKVFNPNVLVNERSRKIEVGSRLRFGDFTPMEMEVMSQPKEPSFFAAKEAFDRIGSVMDNANALLLNPEVQHSPELHGAERTALYKITMIGLDHMRSEFWENPESFDAEEGNEIDNALERLDIQYGNFGTEVGRIASSMVDLTPFINGRKAAKEYTGAIIQQWKKRFGAKGLDFIDEVRAKMNKVASDAMSGVVTRGESVAFFRRVLKDLDSKEWRKAMRKTLVNESEKMKGIARRVASRAAEMGFGNLESEPALKEAARRILNDMAFLPKQSNSEEAATILSQAISEVTRETARNAGVIPESIKRPKVTELQKLSAILQSPELYDDFVTNLEERASTKFGGDNQSPDFRAALDKFTGDMRNQSWMQGLLESVVEEKTRAIKKSIQKVARETIGQGQDYIDFVTKSLTSELRQHGLEDPRILKAVAEDLDSMLNDSVEKAREKWAGTPGAVRKTLKDIGETVNRVAKQGFLTREEIGRTLARRFIDQLGLANSGQFLHADRLQEIIQKSLGEMVDTERKNILANITKNADPAIQEALKKRGARDRRTTIDRIIEMSNVGALTNEKVYGALAEKLGLPRYNPVDATKIQEWGERIGDMPAGRDRLREIVALRDFIESRKGVDWKQMLVAGMYASMLSGPSTHAVNAVSNFLNLMGEVWTQSVLHPERTAKIMRAMLVGLTRGGRLELQEVIASGVGQKLNQKVEGGNPLEYADPVYLDSGAETLGRVLSLTRAKYVVRFLQGVDMMFYKAAQEVSFAGRTGYDGSGDAWAAHVTDARNEFQNYGRDVDSRAGRRAVELRALENMEAARIRDNEELNRAWNESHGEALTTTFNQEPKGWIGKFALMVSKYTGEYPAAKLLVPFTRVVANVLNAQVEWSPFGLARYAFSEDFKMENADGQMVRDPKILVRSMTSMLALGALVAMLSSNDDDDDPWFTIYGSGPKDANKKRQLYERGWKPNTIKVGGAYVSYLPTPMSLSLASLGTLMDRKREKSDMDPMNYIPQLGIAFVQGTLNQSFLSGVADLFSAFESADPEAKVERFLAKTATMPIPNLLKQMDSWIDPSVQQSSTFLDAVIKQLPVARHSLEPMLNVFGQPINKTPGPFNIPFANRFVTMQRDDDPVFAFIGENAVSVPSYSKSTKLGDAKMTEDQYYQYVKTAGPRIYEGIRRAIPSMRNLSKEEKQERIDRITQDIKQDVRNRMRAGSR